MLTAEPDITTALKVYTHDQLQDLSDREVEDERKDSALHICVNVHGLPDQVR